MNESSMSDIQRLLRNLQHLPTPADARAAIDMKANVAAVTAPPAALEPFENRLPTPDMVMQQIQVKTGRNVLARSGTEQIDQLEGEKRALAVRLQACLQHLAVAGNELVAAQDECAITNGKLEDAQREIAVLRNEENGKHSKPQMVKSDGVQQAETQIVKFNASQRAQSVHEKQQSQQLISAKGTETTESEWKRKYEVAMSENSELKQKLSDKEQENKTLKRVAKNASIRMKEFTVVSQENQRLSLDSQTFQDEIRKLQIQVEESATQIRRLRDEVRLRVKQLKSQEQENHHVKTKGKYDDFTLNSEMKERPETVPQIRHVDGSLKALKQAQTDEHQEWIQEWDQWVNGTVVGEGAWQQFSEMSDHEEPSDTKVNIGRDEVNAPSYISDGFI